MSKRYGQFESGGTAPDILVPGELGPVIATDMIRNMLIESRSQFTPDGQNSDIAPENRGLSLDAAASLLGWSASKICRIETGQRPLRADDTQNLMVAYGLPDAERETTIETLGTIQVMRRQQKARYGADFPEHILRYAEHENYSRSVDVYSNIVVPSLLRTATNAHGIDSRIMRDDDPTPMRLAAYELLRQDRIARLFGPNGPALRFILQEGALLRPVAATPPSTPGQQYALMLEQLERIKMCNTAVSGGDQTLGLNPNVSIQINPFRGIWTMFSGLSQVTTLLELNDSGRSTLDYMGEPGEQIFKIADASPSESAFSRTSFQKAVEDLPGPAETAGIIDATQKSLQARYA